LTRTTVQRVLPLTFGWEDLPKSISIYGADPSIRLREPVPGVLIELDGGWLLLDTGFNDPLVRDPALYARFHGRNNDVHALLLPGPQDSLEQAFELVGVDPGDVVMVAVSHFHNDHSGGLRHFAPRVPVHCQRREYEYGLNNHPEPEQHAMIRLDFDDPQIDWRLADGDTEIAPGVEAITTFGHTPGHQSFAVTLSDKLAEALGVPGFVFAFDAADLQENIDDELSVGCLIDVEPEASIEAIRRLKAIAGERGFRIVPGHDPVVWPAFTAELGVPGPPAL
jgi:N-acyl homoserine lactone hydrolase